ncbi:hypothetical protein JOQ06_022804 [Pogonophryne albipinna]|uniref:MKRN2 opposite strand protein-like C-terminal domain-containing protein n=1 Tax=Pogonophryne albipinna TaxID=1090488 RepID=A0AAD6F5G6_9TELE|nr:hypothetical protein JOQ06_022804 [Pogonophryne albipinna]
MDPPVIRLAHCQVQVFCLQVPGAEFDGTSDLHTGISNTEGVVYNYTRAGVVRELSGWERCVSVPLVRPDMFHLLNQVLAAEGREVLSRETFTQIFILPRVQRVQKYLFLYKHLQTHQYYLVDREEDTQEDTQEEI